MRKVLKEREDELRQQLQGKIDAATATLNKESQTLTEIQDALSKFKDEGLDLRADIESDRSNMYGIVNKAKAI